MVKKIFIDAGHGGYDSGATSGLGYKEKDLALKMALDVGRKIEKMLQVSYTRSTDVFVSLQDRAKMSNNNKADAFVSIHLNSFNKVAKGYEIFSTSSKAKGFELCKFIDKEFTKDKLFTSYRGQKFANFYVIRNTVAPSVLIELVFIDNDEDLKFLLKNWDRFVLAIANGILNFFKMDAIKEEIKVPEHTPNKVIISLLGEFIGVDGFYKNDVNYVKIEKNFIPIRAIFESLGLEVGWNNEHKYITANTTSHYKPDKENIRIQLLGTLINVNGFKRDGINMVKINDVYIPIRSLFEEMGLKVGWRDKDQTVLVDRK